MPEFFKEWLAGLSPAQAEELFDWVDDTGEIFVPVLQALSETHPGLND